jgi:hypothetical protein
MRVPVTKSWRELGIDADEAPEGVRASLTGAVPRRTTFSTWFNRQPAATKKEILGASRYELFKSGKIKIDQFATTSRVLTLKQLKKKFGLPT